MTLPKFNPSDAQLRLIKLVLYVLLLIPLLRLLNGWREIDASGTSLLLGANPIEFTIRELGTWTFNCLLFTLCVTPLRKLAGWPWLIRVRRLLGLFSFFYGTLHLFAYIGLDQGFLADEIVYDIQKHPYIMAGLAAWLTMLPLAITSTPAAIRALGGKRWQQIHRLVYVTAVAAALHYLWLVKPVAIVTPALYAAAVALLLGWRWREFRRQRATKLEQLRQQNMVPARPKAQPIVFMKRK
jgi:sulfoxide reductase heme-binding subunit YedZ